MGKIRGPKSQVHNRGLQYTFICIRQITNLIDSLYVGESWKYLCRGQSPVSGVFINHSPSYFLNKKNLSLNLELTEQARMAGQWGSGILLSAPISLSPISSVMCTTSPVAFTWVVETKLKSSVPVWQALYWLSHQRAPRYLKFLGIPRNHKKIPGMKSCCFTFDDLISDTHFIWYKNSTVQQKKKS